MPVILTGATSGSTTLQATDATTQTLTLPAGTGTLALTSQIPSSPSVVGQIPFSTDGSTYTPTAKIVSGTAVASTSGTSIDFTSIPSWVKRVTVMFDGVSTNGTSNPLIQLGDSGGVENTGYLSAGTFLGATTSGTSYTAGFGLPIGNATHVVQGFITFCNLTGNVWTANGSLAGSGSAAGYIYSTAGSKTLSATLDRVRITTVNGTDTFDAGSINILFE